MRAELAFIFAGQGSQYVGMGKEILTTFPEANKLMEQANEILGFDLKKLCLHGPAEELNHTPNTQPAIYTLSQAIYQVLKAKGISPKVVAGHSLGEYSALAAAGVLSFEDGLRLVRQRGIFMDEALPAGLGTMAAIIGLDLATIKQICQEVEGVCEVANFNSPQQIVISGELAATREVMHKADKAGAKKVVELQVSGPFHSSLMEPARQKLAQEIEKIEFHKPEIAFVANTTGDFLEDVKEIKKALLDQLTSSVRWVESINAMRARGVNTFVEIGPGKVLKGLMRRIARDVKAYNVEDLKSLHNFLGGFDNES